MTNAGVSINSYNPNDAGRPSFTSTDSGVAQQYLTNKNSGFLGEVITQMGELLKQVRTNGYVTKTEIQTFQGSRHESVDSLLYDDSAA